MLNLYWNCAQICCELPPLRSTGPGTPPRKKEVPVEDRIRGAFWGALVSDALCLGSHYEYDAKARTRRKFRTSSEKNGRFCR